MHTKKLYISVITGPFKDKTINTSIFTEKVNLCNKVIATKVIMKLRKNSLKTRFVCDVKTKKKRELKESAVETKEICRKRWRSPFRTAKPNLHVENQQLEISIMSLKRYDVTRLAAGHARGVSCHNLIDSERLLKKNLACRLEIMLDHRSFCQNNTRAWIVPVITVTCQVGPEDSID